jgi:hypothetical protein
MRVSPLVTTLAPARGSKKYPNRASNVFGTESGRQVVGPFTDENRGARRGCSGAGVEKKSGPYPGVCTWACFGRVQTNYGRIQGRVWIRLRMDVARCDLAQL